MTTLLLFNSEDNSKGVKTLATDPNYEVPSIIDIDGHNYEVRDKDEDGDTISYSLSDSAVEQN